ncbi:MAG TPA: hypothetical protein PKC28_02610 [Bdellovibrionales bacterium]|nr:hypothetical protein [Bdellovibrionales bacterium]
MLHTLTATLAFTLGTAWAAPVPNATIRGLPTAAVDDQVAVHAVERRGFVRVPFDYARPSAEKVHIFYRWIPSLTGASAPTLIYINGGPGMAATSIRELDYDYTAMPADRLTELLRVFNVVLVDQRGTGGQSFPLVYEAWARTDLEKVGRYMNADVLALDHANVAEKLVRLGLADASHLYVMAHSFGLHVGQSYIRLLAERRIATAPTGMILSAGQLADPLWTWTGARPNQENFSHEALRYSLREGLEPFNALVLRVKAHFAHIGADPELVHFAYADITPGEPDVLYSVVADFLTLKSKAEVDDYMMNYSDAYGALNPVLSVQSLNGGRMAGEILRDADRHYPMDSWIIDPLKAFAMEEKYNARKSDALERLVARGRIVSPRLPTRAQFEAFMSRSKLMFHWGRKDPITGAEVGRQIVANMLGQGVANRAVFLTSGAHRDIRSIEGVTAIRGYFGL